MIEAHKGAGERCVAKSLNFRALFAFSPCASKTRKSRFIRLAVKLSAGYLRPPNGAPKGIGRDGRRSENEQKVFGHNGTLRGNKRAREREGDGGRNVRYFSHFGDYGLRGDAEEGDRDRGVGDLRCTWMLNTRKQEKFLRIIFVTILSEFFLLWDIFLWIEVPGACGGFLFA